MLIMAKQRAHYRYISSGHEVAARRRAGDQEWAAWTPEWIACTSCHVGIALMSTFVTIGVNRSSTYVCRDCGHRFDRAAES
jgi:predicted RNA-binding Zn-ribbon protein involved in translation (DUF1610 family)